MQVFKNVRGDSLLVRIEVGDGSCEGSVFTGFHTCNDGQIRFFTARQSWLDLYRAARTDDRAVHGLDLY